MLENRFTAKHVSQEKFYVLLDCDINQLLSNSDLSTVQLASGLGGSNSRTLWEGSTGSHGSQTSNSKDLNQWTVGSFHGE